MNFCRTGFSPWTRRVSGTVRGGELCESRAGREATVEEVSVSALARERYGLDLGARVDCLS